jgi:hypothetical protein
MAISKRKMTNRDKKKRMSAIEGVAENYANELDAQFQTLNNFVGHGGEIGRAHEYYLRGVLARFLPDDLCLGSGFIASPNWTSRQQDILIYRRDYTTLFKVGDCVVVDYEALVGTIEVKTNVDSSNKFLEALETISEVVGRYRNPRFRALYAWDGIKLDTTLETLWKFVREDPTNRAIKLPNLIYIRGQFLLIANENMHKIPSPFSLWRIDQGELTDGQALLGLVASVWRFGLPELNPWWLISWHDYHGHLPAKAEQIQWPPDLMKILVNDGSK